MPPPVERTGDQYPEQPADLGAGQEVPPRPTRAATPGEEPFVLVVERVLDELVEGDGPLTRDALPEEAAQRGTASSPTRANSWG